MKVAAFFWGVTKMMIGKGAPKSLVTRCDLKKSLSQVSQLNQKRKKHTRTFVAINWQSSQTFCQVPTQNFKKYKIF